MFAVKPNKSSANINGLSFFFGLFILLEFLISINASASQTNIRFQRYSLEQGLSQEAVFSILQDSRGFMWFATQEGLNRFDGYQFRTFYHDPDNNNSLVHDVIYSMMEDHQGAIWLGTDGGLDRFDPVTETFTHYGKENHHLSSDRINVVYQDNDLNIWVGTDGGGLNRFDRKTQVFDSFRHRSSDKNSLNHDNVRSIHQDQSGQIWVGTDKGINLFIPENQSFDNFDKNAKAPNSLKNDSIRSIFSDHLNRLWVGTHQHGVIRIDDFRIKDKDILKIENKANFKRFHTASKEELIVRDIYQDNDQLIWLATDDGLRLWQEQNNRFVIFRNDPANLYSISDNRAITVYQDRGGVLWLGTFGGINKWVPTKFEHYTSEPDNDNSLSSNIIMAFAENNNDNNIWVGSYDGLNKFEPDSKTFTRIKADKNNDYGLSDNRIMSLFMGRDNSLWVGTRRSGVDRYNPTTQRFKHYRHSKKDSKSLSGNGITDIFEDQQGRLWIAAYKAGLNLFNKETESFSHYRHDPNDPQSISSDRVVTIYQTRDNVLWIGTEGGGLNRLDSIDGKFTRIKHSDENKNSLSNNHALSILESSNGDLWIGTWGGGLNRWRFNDRKNNIVHFSHYGKKNGLLSNVIYDILEDPNGYLWLSTNRGLNRFDINTGQAKQYDISHGLQDNEFNHNASLTSRSGQLFFGGSNGFNAFYADQVIASRKPPRVALTSIKTLNKSDGISNSLHALQDMVFGYQDYVLSFDYSSLDFAAPEKNRYKYKLEGFDQDWIDSGTTHRTTYTNLPAGDYIFRVKGSNNDDSWSENGLSQSIKITPAPWRTWWAYSLYILCFLSAAYAYIRMQKNKLKEKAEYSLQLESQVKQRTSELTIVNRALKFAKQAAEESDQAKGVFISTMSHELRTPMTNVIGYAESLLEDEIDRKEVNRRANKIIISANHLLQLMNNVLDISKIEADRIDVEQISVNPVQLLQEVEELIEIPLNEKKLAFTIHYEYPIPLEIKADPTRLKQVLLNLCSNAIKFTETGSIDIFMRADSKTNKLHFKVVDTGIGIPNDKINIIFEAFSQADASTTRKFGGTGLGLSISKQLSKAMGGDMTLVTKEGVGSQFIFSISMGNPSPEQWIDGCEGLTDSLKQKKTVEYTVPKLNGHVLLAEDWPDNQVLIRLYIERTGAKVTLVENGEQAVEKALSESFDLILMDIQMPVIDGVEATKILRAAGFSKPIIALTANVTKSDIAHYLKSGLNQHLTKPIDRVDFYQTLASHLPSSSVVDFKTSSEFEQQEKILTDNFLRRLPEMVTQIEQAIAQENWQTLRRLLHNLKGLGGSFGFPIITKLAEPIDALLSEGNRAQAINNTDVLLKAVSRIVKQSKHKSKFTNKLMATLAIQNKQ